MRITKRQLRRIIREESHHADWGMGSHEKSRTHPGEEDYTGHMGDESKTHPGEDDYEGGDVEHKAHAAVAAIQDLASAAGVDLDAGAPGPDDLSVEEESMVAMENRRYRRGSLSRRQLRRIIREERRKLREDHIDTELDNLRKNVEDDVEHIRSLKDDIKDDHEEEKRAEKEKERHDEALRRKLRRIVRENTRPRRRVRRYRR